MQKRNLKRSSLLRRISKKDRQFIAARIKALRTSKERPLSSKTIIE